MKTSIPVFLLILENNSENILFIDASKEYEKQSKYNIIKPRNTERILCAYNGRFDVDKFAKVSTVREIKKNEYNLNIPRYVDTFEPEPLPDIIEVAEELLNINKGIRETEDTLYKMMLELTSEDAQREEELKKIVKTFGRIVDENSIDDRCVRPGDAEKREDISKRNNNDMSCCSQQRGTKQANAVNGSAGYSGKLCSGNTKEWEQLDLFTLCGMS